MLRIFWKLAPATAREPIPSSYTLRPVSVAHTWLGYSQRLAVAYVNNTAPFSLKRLTLPPSDYNGVLAIAWPISPYMGRFKFSDEGVLHFAEYNGETIGPNAVFELWSAKSGTVAFPGLTLSTATIAEYPSCDYQCKSAPAVTELTWADPDAVIPYYGAYS